MLISPDIYIKTVFEWLVPAYPGCPGSKAVKRSLLLLFELIILPNLVVGQLKFPPRPQVRVNFRKTAKTARWWTCLMRMHVKTTNNLVSRQVFFHCKLQKAVDLLNTVCHRLKCMLWKYFTVKYSKCRIICKSIKHKCLLYLYNKVFIVCKVFRICIICTACTWNQITRCFLTSLSSALLR